MLLPRHFSTQLIRVPPDPNCGLLRDGEVRFLRPGKLNSTRPPSARRCRSFETSPPERRGQQKPRAPTRTVRCRFPPPPGSPGRARISERTQDGSGARQAPSRLPELSCRAQEPQSRCSRERAHGAVSKCPAKSNRIKPAFETGIVDSGDRERIHGGSQRDAARRRRCPAKPNRIKASRRFDGWLTVAGLLSLAVSRGC